MPHISINNLFVRYGSEMVLSDINCVIERGDFLAVAGPNGSGKTTLIKTIVGLLTPVEGSIIFNDGEQNGVCGDCIGYLPQKSTSVDPLFPTSVREVVASGLEKRRVYDASDKEQVEEILHILEIHDLANKRVGLLSGGQQQRVHLARALVSNPSLLVLDEPTAALDPHTRECFYKTIAALNAEHHITVIMVTHDVSAIRDYARSVLYLDRKLQYYGSMKEYFSQDHEHYFNHTHHTKRGV